MKKNYKVPIYGLDRFDLNLQELTNLGKHPVTLRIRFKHIDASRLFSLPRLERLKRIEEWHRKIYIAVERKVPTKEIKPFELIAGDVNPRGITVIVKAQEIHFLQNIPDLGSIGIEEIAGFKRKKPPRIEEQRWFTVHARFAIQIEDQVEGMQTYEDRMILVKTTTADKAKKMLQKSFKEYGRPYLNSDGYMVRWAFESILDVYHVLDEEIIDEGTEVFSVMKNRKLRPEYQWKP